MAVLYEYTEGRGLNNTEPRVAVNGGYLLKPKRVAVPLIVVPWLGRVVRIAEFGHVYATHDAK